MSVGGLEIIGVTSAVAAGILAQVPPLPVMEEFGKWPLPTALVALSGFCVWAAFRNADKARLSQDAVTASLRDLVAQLSQRPCIRSKEND